MNYTQTLDFLFKQLPMYQNEGKTAFKKDLNNTMALCEILQNPQHQFKSIHIAGTNGKGSTAHMLASVFQEAGYKTGLYTSPHLKDFRERIRINGKMIRKKSVVNFVKQHQHQFAFIKPSFFEWTVALAFHTFAQEGVDIAIIETGLGGRLDSTNVINPELSIITNVGLDHTDLLGETPDLIAREKAGIIKHQTPVVICDDSGQKQIFEKVAKEQAAPAYFTNEIKLNVELKTDLLGHYQAQNSKGVYHAWFLLRKLGWKISFPQFEKGLMNVVRNTQLRGRWEILGHHPLIIAETAHNEDGLKAALNQLYTYIDKQVHFVLGFVKDKKLNEVLKLFPSEGKYYFCQAKVPRALNVKELEEIANQFGLVGNSFNTVQAAYNEAKELANSSDIIYVGGSNFVVAEVL